MSAELDAARADLRAAAESLMDRLVMLTRATPSATEAPDQPGYQVLTAPATLGIVPCRVWPRDARGLLDRVDGRPALGAYRMAVPVTADVAPGDVAALVTSAAGEPVHAGHWLVRAVTDSAAQRVLSLEEVT